MTQTPEKQAKSPKPQSPNDLSPEAARARVNARRAAEGKPPLPADPPPRKEPMHPLMAQALERTARVRAEWEEQEAARRREAAERAANAPPAPPPLSWAEKREAGFRKLDEFGWENAREAGGLMPFVSKLPPFGEPQPRLPDPAEKRAGFALPDAPALASRGPDETEALLNGVIGDCRLFLREIVFHSARLAALESDRTCFIDAACRVAKTAGGVGKQIAKLRRAANAGQIGENRQRIIVERVERLPAHMIAEREGGV